MMALGHPRRTVQQYPEKDVINLKFIIIIKKIDHKQRQAMCNERAKMHHVTIMMDPKNDVHHNPVTLPDILRIACGKKL